MVLPRALQPRFWGLHLAAALAVGAAAMLGLWQYDAWQARRAAEARDLTTAEPLPLSDVLGPDDPFPADRVGQPVELAGTWLPGGTVYVSGREQEGRDGFWVATPVAVGTPGDAVLFVVRGWVESPERAPAPPSGPARAVAWLQPGQATGETDADPSDDVVPQLRTADLVQRLPQDLYGGYAVVDRSRTPAGPATAGLAPATLLQPPDVGGFTALRNLLYALEWWFFGLFAAFLWWRWLQEEVLPAAPVPVPAESGATPAG